MDNLDDLAQRGGGGDKVGCALGMGLRHLRPECEMYIIKENQ